MGIIFLKSIYLTAYESCRRKFVGPNKVLAWSIAIRTRILYVYSYSKTADKMYIVNLKHIILVLGRVMFQFLQQCRCTVTGGFQTRYTLWNMCMFHIVIHNILHTYVHNYHVYNVQERFSSFGFFAHGPIIVFSCHQLNNLSIFQTKSLLITVAHKKPADPAKSGHSSF